MTSERVENVVLVHGGFVDGSGWREAHRLLTDDGFRVNVVRNPALSLAGDVALTERVLDALDGPAILVGHSYGGAVITEAGNHDRVAGLVYIAAFVPDKGESVNTLIAEPEPGAPVAMPMPMPMPMPPILPPVDGFLFLDRAKFHTSFAADVPVAQAEFMADAQVPWGLDALRGAIGEPAWRHKPSWYLVATDDRMIPPPAQRAMARRAGSAVTGTDAGHSVHVSRPDAVADLVRQAAADAVDAV
ncbi:alpha/beta fold hydrolase [Streptomyces sp. NPDC013161]|uniref:alpha/beta fold hydrolase n=1 Tax=Streptomyces sp. NPDC013161 TaxID=3364862 RepID=UPI0036A8C2BA